MYIKEKELHLVWCIEDVIHQAKGNDTPVTDEQALEVLGLMLKRHDCNYGITWEDMDLAIKDVLKI